MQTVTGTYISLTEAEQQVKEYTFLRDRAQLRGFFVVAIDQLKPLNKTMVHLKEFPAMGRIVSQPYYTIAKLLQSGDMEYFIPQVKG